MKKENILGIKFPQLAQEWHPTKNGLLTPMDVTYGLSKKVWWQCTKGHEWETSLNNRSKGKGCPYCSGVKVSLEASLLMMNPPLAKEWHPTKNEKLTPAEVLQFSDKKVWWQCQQGHEWRTQVKTRSKGSGCPYCSNRLVNEENCLAYLLPSLAKEWHVSKNESLTPKDVVPGSNKKVWWMCKKGHEYQSTIVGRVTKNTGCPYCSNSLVNEGNCLATLNAKLAKEWHPIKNKNLTPKDVVPGSNKKVWWQCVNGHEWQAVINSRNSGNHQCPYCTNQKVSEDNCLQNVNPELTKEWHSTRNRNLTPRDVTAGSSKVVWWQCKHNKEHVWEASVAARNAGYGCKKCSAQTSFPEQTVFFYIKKLFKNAETRRKFGEYELDIYIAELNLGIEYDGYHHSLKGALERDEKKDLYFKSKKIPLIRIRSYEAPPYESEDTFIIKETKANGKSLKETLNILLRELKKRTTDSQIKMLIDSMDINIDRDRAEIYSNMRKVKLANSFAVRNPQMANEWHPIKNGELTPYEIEPHSNRKYWWLCNSGHEFEQRANDRSRGQKCPYCVGQKATAQTNLVKVNPRLASEWHPTKNGELTPDKVTAGSNRKVWWKCSKGHNYPAIIANRASKGSGCPYCANKKVCSDNNLMVIHPELAAEWHPEKNGELTPKDIVFGSNIKVWWMCKRGHEWLSSPSNRRRKSNCPHC